MRAQPQEAIKTEIRACEAGGSFSNRRAAARFTGYHRYLALIPGVALAKPRSTPGYMITPAPQARSPAPLPEAGFNLAMVYLSWITGVLLFV